MYCRICAILIYGRMKGRQGVPAHDRVGSIRPPRTHRALRLGHPVTILDARNRASPQEFASSHRPTRDGTRTLSPMAKDVVQCVCVGRAPLKPAPKLSPTVSPCVRDTSCSMGSFRQLDQFAEAHIQSISQVIGDFDSDAYFSELNRTHISSMHACSLRKILLRKPQFLSFFPYRAAEASSGEFCCLGHDILLVSCTRSIYRRSSTRCQAGNLMVSVTAKLDVRQGRFVDSFSTGAKLPAFSLAKTKLEDSSSQGHNTTFEDRSDEELLSCIQAGEPEALGCLFRRYFRIVSGIGRRILRDEVEAQDLVQDVFLYIHRKCRVYNPARGTASSWIVQTIYYQALQRRVSLTASQHYSTLEIENGGAEALLSASILAKDDHSAEIVFGKSKWREILETLTGDQWETLRMHFFEGYTLGEIAEKRGQSVGNTRHHFYRGLDALRKQVFSGELNRRATNNGK
jgi:RNA polymerase sigma-70 factor, ECF subfamily